MALAVNMWSFLELPAEAQHDDIRVATIRRDRAIPTSASMPTRAHAVAGAHLEQTEHPAVGTYVALVSGEVGAGGEADRAVRCGREE